MTSQLIRIQRPAPRSRLWLVGGVFFWINAK